MKNIQDKIIESNDKLPKLRPLKKIPEWCMSYPEFYDKIDKIWDDDDLENNNKLFIATMVYFMTGDKDADGYGPAMIKAKIKDLYHK